MNITFKNFMKKTLNLLIVLFIGIILILYKLYDINKPQESIYEAHHVPNKEFINQIEQKVIVTLTPEIKYSYDIMEKGVIQHLDRKYTYDYIPKELENGILYQGVHQPIMGTSIHIELFERAAIYFFFHSSVDGGYTEIFKNKKEWQECYDTPKYDIENGDHGLNMTMYKINADAGKYTIPATTKDRACFNIVFQF